MSVRFRLEQQTARLQILNELRAGPLNVTALMNATELNQANLSKHLQLLHTQNFVVRRREGLFVVYALADDSVFALCDIMCAQLKRRASEVQRRLRA